MNNTTQMSEDKDVARTELKIWLFHTIGKFKSNERPDISLTDNDVMQILAEMLLSYTKHSS